MELCSLEDAFPNLTPPGQASGTPYVGGTDAKPSKEERRAARKRAKACKGPAKVYHEVMSGESPPLTDPDRPAVKRLEGVEPMSTQGTSVSIYNKPWGQKPIVPPPSPGCIISNEGLPRYFGQDEEADEGFADFRQVGGDDESYRLVPDFTKVFDFKGLEKAAGGGVKGSLPEPNLNDSWKPNQPGSFSYTAYTGDEDPGNEKEPWSLSMPTVQFPKGPTSVHQEPPPAKPVAQGPQLLAASSGMEPAIQPANSSRLEERDRMLSRIDELMGRIDRLERARSQDTQKELLLFVGTGLFLLFSFNVAAKL